MWLVMVSWWLIMWLELFGIFEHHPTGLWFGTCFIFLYIGNNHPKWRIFQGPDMESQRQVQRGRNHQPALYWGYNQQILESILVCDVQTLQSGTFYKPWVMTWVSLHGDLGETDGNTMWYFFGIKDGNGTCPINGGFRLFRWEHHGSKLSWWCNFQQTTFDCWMFNP